MINASKYNCILQEAFFSSFFVREKVTIPMYQELWLVKYILT